jgi:DNA-binding IclR family transcriptional regulator
MLSHMVEHAPPDIDVATEEAEAGRGAGGAQTLLRGLDVLEAVADGGIGLADLAQRLGLTRSTTHRLASALVERRFLVLAPREGYSLGPKLLELGYLAQLQRELYVVAHSHLEALSTLTEDTVHMAVLDEDRALYLDKIPGRRRIEIRSRIGDRQPVTSTGVGKALILDATEARWRELYAIEGDGSGPGQVDLETWLTRMRAYAVEGRAFDLEENEDRLRCVAAPIRGVTGRIVGAISVSGAAQYMNDDRLLALSQEVKSCARAISEDLGWTPGVVERRPATRTRKPKVAG